VDKELEYAEAYEAWYEDNFYLPEEQLFDKWRVLVDANTRAGMSYPTWAEYKQEYAVDFGFEIMRTMQ